MSLKHASRPVQSPRPRDDNNVVRAIRPQHISHPDQPGNPPVSLPRNIEHGGITNHPGQVRQPGNTNRPSMSSQPEQANHSSTLIRSIRTDHSSDAARAAHSDHNNRPIHSGHAERSEPINRSRATGQPKQARHPSQRHRPSNSSQPGTEHHAPSVAHGSAPQVHIEQLEPAAARARIEAAFSRKKTPKVGFFTPLIALIWAMALAYYLFMPPLYKSKWTLILPAAKNGSSVSLESIGHTSSQPGQPFGSASLSPKVIYKEIAGSEQVRSSAADKLGISTKEFGRPRVKLIDETSLILFQMGGRTPKEAQSKANALMIAFNEQLDLLRRDELEKRATFERENLKVYRTKLNEMRKRIVEFQRSSGLLSTEQFSETSTSVELLRRKLVGRRADQQRLLSEQRALKSRIGLSPRMAAKALRLTSNPAFNRLASEYSKVSAELHHNRLRFGKNHPRIRISELQLKGALAQLAKVARGSSIENPIDLGKIVLIANSTQQSELLQSIVANEATLAGLNEELGALDRELLTLESRVAHMGKDAARLEALQKDRLVAEAVFTSAAARLNISLTDQFSSYPMVQALSKPSLPIDRSQPRLLYALAAGILGSLLIFLAWGAAWIRAQYARKR